VTGYQARAWTALTGGTQAGFCNTGSLTCTVTGLTPGTTYYVDVYAANAQGTGPFSTPRVAVTPVAPLSAPQSVNASAGVSRAVVTWTAPASDGGSPVTGYQARAWTALTGGTQAGFCNTNLLTCTIWGLTGGTTYYVDVYAANAQGTGPFSTPRVAVTPTP
jgi:hypothetical protein